MYHVHTFRYMCIHNIYTHILVCIYTCIVCLQNLLYFVLEHTAGLCPPYPTTPKPYTSALLCTDHRTVHMKLLIIYVFQFDVIAM